jgi:transcriptional regulator with XRE-family HTH domain
MTRAVPTSLSQRLGNKIAKLRRAKGLTQAQAEQLIGSHPGYWSRVESGHIQPNIETLAAISKVLGVSLPRLVTGIVEDES